MRQTGIIYVATLHPSELTDELILAGFRMWEALAESEIKYLCETEDVDALVLAHDVPHRKRIASESGRVCVLLEPTTTTADLV
jgi:predicted GTPase